MWKPQKTISRALAVQTWLLMLLVVMFVDLAALSPVTVKLHISTAHVLFILALNVLFLILSAYIIYSYRTRAGIRYLCKVKTLIKEPVFVLMLIYIITRLFYLDTLQRWDGAWYFCRLIESVKSFDFTPGNFVSNFNWFGHPSMGYAFLMSPGQFMDPGNHYLLNVQSLILAVLGVFLFYKILICLYGGSRTEITLLTALFAFNPLFFGVSLSFNPDFPLVVFWLALIYALLHERFILAVFCGIMLVFSKETGVLIYFLFVLSLLLIFVFCKFSSGIHRPLYVSPRVNAASAACLVLPLMMFLIFFLYRRGELWGGGSLGWDSNGFHTFGFNWVNFKTTLMQVFVLDFSWIPYLIIIIYLVKLIFTLPLRKIVFINSERTSILLINLCVFWGYLVFNLFYITYNHPRYIVLAVVFLLLFAYHALKGLARNGTVRIAVLSLMMVLFAAQTYRTVDPLSKLVFGTTTLGKHELLAINPADGLVYNAEYTVIDKLLNKVNEEIKINGNSKIILSNDGWDAHFNGVEGHTAINIDKVTLKRTFKGEDAFRPQTFSVWDISEDNKPQSPYYLYMSWFGDEMAELAYLQKYYRVVETRVIEHSGYFFKLYKLD